MEMSYRLKQSRSRLEEALPARPISAFRGCAVYVSRMVLQVPICLVKSISATESSACSGCGMVGRMLCSYLPAQPMLTAYVRRGGEGKKALAETIIKVHT